MEDKDKPPLKGARVRVTWPVFNFDACNIQIDDIVSDTMTLDP